MSLAAARLLGLTQQQLAYIVADEAASPAQAAEAVRRMLQNPQFTSGQLHSAAAFYRGILRRVVAECSDHTKATARSTPAEPVSADLTTARQVLADLASRLAAQN